MKMTFDRKLIAGFIACACILLSVAIYTFKNSERFITSNNLVDHTNQVLHEFELILISTIDAETGTRGFIISGNEDYLEFYINAHKRAFEHLEKAKELTKDNHDEQRNIEVLENELKLRFDNLEYSVALGKKDFVKAKDFVSSQKGKRIQDQIRKTIASAQQIEYKLLADRKGMSKNDAHRFNLVLGSLLLIILLILIIVYFIITTYLKALKRAEKALMQLYEKLEDRVRERTVDLLKLNEDLKENEEKYRTVADFASNWEFWLDSNDSFLYCSPSCVKITGYSVIEFEQNPGLLFEIIHPDDLQIFQDHKIQEQQSLACEHEIQYRLIRKDGTVSWIGHSCQPVFDSRGNNKGIRGSNKDITARKKTDELLTTSNQKYKLLSENIIDGIFICKNGNFVYANKAIYDIFGYEGIELESMKLTQLVTKDFHEELENILSTNASMNQSYTIEIECLKKDFSFVYVEILLNYVSSDQIVYGVIHDITDKKLLQRNTLKTISQTEEKERANFSKELHDSLGPLLSTIKLYLQWSERPNTKMPREEIIGKALDIVDEAIITVKEVSNKLSPHLLTNYGLNSAIQSFVEKLNTSGTFSIIFDSNTTRRIDLDIEVALYRIVIECINNTMKYAQAYNIHIELEDTGAQFKLRYTDDGIGFDMDKIFKQHKGLGLFNLHNRMQMIGGKLLLKSQPGKGVDYMFTKDI